MSTSGKKSTNKILFVALGVVVGFFVYKFLLPEEEKPPCNGFVELCDRKITDVVFPMTHNSMSIEDYDWFGPSHENSIRTQLDSGIRGLMIDTHYYDATESIGSYFLDAGPLEVLAIQAIVDKVDLEVRVGVYVCHLICQLGSTPLVSTLSEIRSFLEDNPREVVVIIFEDRISKEDTIQAFSESGLLPFVYDHGGGDWPAVDELIARNNRLVVFAEYEGSPPSWYMNAWEFVEETPYSFAEAEEMNCSPNRGGTGKDFFLMNNWIERVIPRKSDASGVNEYDFLLERARKCEEERGGKPNFISVNFSKEGDLFRVVNELNGVRDISEE